MSGLITREHVDAALAKASTTKQLLFGSGVLEQVAALVQQTFPDRPALLVMDEITFDIAGRQVQAGLVAAGHPVLEPVIFSATPTLRPDTVNVERVRQQLAAAGEPVLPLAVGSGVVNDLTKRAAFEADLPYIVVGTAASMDGYTASGAALIHEGVKQTLPCPAPVAVVADLDILCAAPRSMTASGYGDLVGKITAGADWLIADALGIELLDPPVWDMVQGPLRAMIAAPARLQRGEPEAIEQLFYGLVMTGLAIQIAGGTRPASGSEHQFSHLWEMRGLEHEGEFVSHGFKVGLGSLFSTALYECLLQRDLSTLNVEQPVASWPTWSDIERDIRQLDEHPALIERALEECQAKYIPATALRERLELLRLRWPELQRKLREQLLPVAELRALLVEGGCPTDPDEIGLSLGQIRASYAEARLIRRRYTVYDLVYEARIFDDLVAELFAPSGYWATAPIA